MLSQGWYASDPVTAALTRPARFHPRGHGESGVAPFPTFPLGQAVQGSGQTSEHVAVPKGAPRELQRDL